MTDQDKRWVDLGEGAQAGFVPHVPHPPSHAGAVRRPRLCIVWKKAIQAGAPIHLGLGANPNCGLSRGMGCKD